MAFTIVDNAWCRNLVDGLKFQSLNQSGNGNANYALDEYGRLWSWGKGYYGELSQGNGEYLGGGTGLAYYNHPERLYSVSPQLIRTKDDELKYDWVKINVGEFSIMAIDKEGRLWGCGNPYSRSADDWEGNCAAFGLPQDSGDLPWDGSEPIVNRQYNFFKMTRCAPSYTVKDFSHCYYHTFMIGQDDLLYVMGHDTQSGVLGSSVDPTSDRIYYEVPTRVTNVTNKIKLLAVPGGFNYAWDGFVTVDNEVYIMGTDSDYVVADIGTAAPYIFNITDNLPANAVITHMSMSWRGLLVTLSNGDVWGRGDYGLIAHPDYDDSYFAWYQVPVSNIVYAEVSQDGAFGIDKAGYLWVWDYPEYPYGLNVDNCDSWGEGFPTVATKRRWKRVMHNYYQSNWAGIDVYGNLYAWGNNALGPNLGIGTSDLQTVNDLLETEKEPVKESCVPLLCDIPDLSSVDFHWPRATHIPMPKYFNRS